MDNFPWLDVNTSTYQSSSGNQKIPDSHLQSPIRPDHRRFLTVLPTEWPSFVREVLETFPVKFTDVEIDSEVIYGTLLNSAINPPDSIVNWVKTHYPECFDCVKRFLDTTLEALDMPPARTRSRASLMDLKLLSLKVLCEDIRIRMQETRTSGHNWSIITQLLHSTKSITICAYYAIIQTTTSNQLYCLDYDQVMMITDTVTSRVFCLIYNDILPLEFPGKIDADVLLQCYDLFDRGFITTGNNTYKDIASWESCCMALMLKYHDRLNAATDYYDWLKNDLETNNLQLAINMLNYLEDQSLSVQQLAELHGLYRHWGHPTVNEALGCKKVRITGKNRPVPIMNTCLRAAGCLKRQFVGSFFSKHGRWPKLQSNKGLAGRPIHKLLTTQNKTLNLYSPEYTLEDLGQVRFNQEFTFDYHLDYTELLEDSALSCQKDDLRSIYNSASLHYKPSPAKTDRRVLNEILSPAEIDVKEICDRIQLNMIPDEWRIIIIHAKEREMKIAPRLFAMMVLEMRIYFCVTEANISKTIFPYFPQKTMTLDEADLSKRLLLIASENQESLRSLSVMIGIDFSSWNICQTYLSTLYTFQFLDDLFGTSGLYLRSHQFF
jgi:hypothetical protein